MIWLGLFAVLWLIGPACLPTGALLSLQRRHQPEILVAGGWRSSEYSVRLVGTLRGLPGEHHMHVMEALPSILRQKLQVCGSDFHAECSLEERALPGPRGVASRGGAIANREPSLEPKKPRMMENILKTSEIKIMKLLIKCC